MKKFSKKFYKEKLQEKATKTFYKKTKQISGGNRG